MRIDYIEDLSFDKFVGIYAYLSLRSHWFLAVICFPGIKENRRVRYICKPKEEKPTNGEANTDKGDNSEKETTESEENPTEVEDKEKSNDTVVKEESPMKEEEEQDTKVL